MLGWMPGATRWKWVTSRVPAKRANGAFTRLLTDADLPGDGWKLLDQRAWKTGRSGADEPWARRARDAKLLTAWRSFEQASQNRWLWVQVSPLVSESDAAAYLDAAPELFLRNARAAVTVVAEQDIEPLALEHETSGWAHEQRTTGARGDGVALYAGFVVGSTLAFMAASGLLGSWDRQELQHVAQLQADRL
jgi:hypothetical protein